MPPRAAQTIAGLAQSLFIPNITPDAGLSAPANSFFTFFGQFFDHGLDLISKNPATARSSFRSRRTTRSMCRAPRPTSWC